AGAKQLVAYVVPGPQRLVDVSALRASLNARLPEYVVPSAFVLLDALPLTANGKVDRKALPAPERALERHRPPRTRTEQILAALFEEVLSVDGVGLDDGFFALGGDSILSMLLVSRARTAGVHLTPRDVFTHQTVEALAAAARTPEAASQPTWSAEAAIGA